MGEFSPWHILIVAMVFVVLFGSHKLPDTARSLGRSLRIFKSELRGLHDDTAAATQTTPPVPVTGNATPAAGDTAGEAAADCRTGRSIFP